MLIATNPAGMSPPEERRALIVLLTVIFLMIAGFGLVIPLLPFFAKAFDAPAWQITLLFSAFSVGQFIGEPIWGKLSDMENRDIPARGLAQVKDRLDVLMDCFGEDRVVFGTNWPETWGVATPAQIVALARAYFATRSRLAAEKFFWKNSLNFYKWKKRAPNQPSL